MAIEKVYFEEEPDTITYQPQKDGTANVYLRKNIEQIEVVQSSSSESGSEAMRMTWVADERNFQTTLTLEEVEAQFDELFSDKKEETQAERIEDLESTIAAFKDKLKDQEATTAYVAMMSDVEFPEESAGDTNE